ncbi:hypothetical protein F5Y15DRAFT_201952 [Xylariaceae sp. FL0016]|nr:hypothetical protein F5Y15DRAFT_201952 [Xylariaceae sp. FL0016]
MANPLGEDNWLAYLDEESRRANDLEARVRVIELFKSAISDEPHSLNIWLAYCEWFWSLFTNCQPPDSRWAPDEQALARDIFTFDSALSLWSDGYEHLKYRISDSHRFWDRWVSIELQQLARTRTPSGVKRISHLFRDRLQIPHQSWDNTSQMFSSFLSTYNNVAYESEFSEVTANAQEAKAAYDAREPHELQLNKAVASGDRDALCSKMRQYLEWEMVQVKHASNRELAIALCLGLYARALSGVFAFDDDVWSNLAVYLSTLYHQAKTTKAYHSLPNMPDFFQRATKHCPWSGPLWSRYILTAEESAWSFHDVEKIKHAATSTKSLDKNGMTGVLDMYTAWCGFLKRTAMNPIASEDAADVAEVGLLAALEDVDLWGKRLYKDAYQGDPNYRLERILIQFLTEVKGDVDNARHHWNRMTAQTLLANSYDFWLNYYLWEMMVFASTPKPRSPTPATPAGTTNAKRVPSAATDVLQRALAQRTLDWPERVMEVYLQHCNDYEQPETLHQALDTIHKTRRSVAKRRERENAEAAATYAAQAQEAQEQTPAVTADLENRSSQSPSSGSKRKREATPGDSRNGDSKKAKNNVINGTSEGDSSSDLKRDRENTSVMVTNLPPDATQTAIRKYFREYGHVNNIVHRVEDGRSSSSALIEFRSTEDAQSALLRDNKYYDQFQITVKRGTGLTLFVSNFPPTADEGYVRHIFKDCGEIFSLRWPSLRYNTHRRFCYITFRNPVDARKATHMDGKVLEGKYKLQAKYSDPTHKKDREGAVAEGRELRVKNIHGSATENDLKSVFGKYGKVASIRIITNMGGQSLGTAYIVFESKDYATNALDLDKTKFKSQILEVELSRETNFKPFATSRGDRVSASPGPSGRSEGSISSESGSSREIGQAQNPKEIQERTIAVMNVPDTINDARIRAIAEKHGTISKLVLRPDHQGAIIEFSDATAAGRAALALEGFEIVPDRMLQIGSAKDMFQRKAQKSQDNARPNNKHVVSGNGKTQPGWMPPPAAIKRPLLGRGGPRRGLGLVASTKEPEKTNDTRMGANGAAEDSRAQPKSNADFKAMFLGKAE